MRLFGNFLILLLIAFPAVVVQDQGGFAYAQEDEILEEEEEEADVASEDEEMVDEDAVTGEATTEEEEESEDEGLKKSADAEAHILFVKPEDSMNLPAGSVVHVIVGFTNNGKDEFMVNNMEASFRYPQDYSYFIQNFTVVNYGKVVESNRQASFEYSFVPSENFNSRPFGLTINLNYQDKEGKMYQDAVFNETVTITDPLEGFDTETFFLWLTLAGLTVLILVALQQTVFSSASKRLTSGKSRVETGTQNNSDIDYDWIPKEALKQATRQSPRKRNNASASSGSGSE